MVLMEAAMNEIGSRSEGFALWILMMLLMMVPWVLE